MTVRKGGKIIAGNSKAVGSCWEIGDVGIAALGIDETQNKRRYLNGQVISQAQFVEFTAMLKSRVSVYPSLATTEVNWQAAVTNSDLGQCGQFVIDDNAGTIRLPKVVNIQGLMDLTSLGDLTEAGLPNITGSAAAVNNFGILGNTSDVSGCFTDGATTGNTLGGVSSTGKKLDFDASGSNSIYGNSTTVQPEAVRYPYFIQVAEGVETSVDVSREIELNNPFSLLDYKYSEYELSNASWLISNGQYNSGATYPAVYNLLLQIYNGTVTKAGVSVKLSAETYTDTDFVLNTSDTTFRLPIKVKLPNSKGVAGNDITFGLNNGIENVGIYRSGTSNALNAQTGIYGSSVGTSASGSNPTNGISMGVTTDPTKSGIEVKDDSSMYLYFYVGETVQDANIIAAAHVLTDVANLKNAVANISLVPDYSAGITVNATSYTAPKNGIVLINCVHVDNNSNNASINGVQVYNFGMSGSYANGTMTPFATPVSAGDVITSNRNILKFYPYKGA